MAKELILIPKTKYEFLTKVQPENVLQISVDESPADEQLETVLKYAVPKNVVNKALGLWNYLKDRKGPVLDWNRDGLISLRGQIVPGCHLIDLLKHAVTPFSQREPTGYDQFRRALQEMHTPTGFIVERKTTKNKQQGRGYVKGKMDMGPPGRKQSFRWIPY